MTSAQSTAGVITRKKPSAVPVNLLTRVPESMQNVNAIIAWESRASRWGKHTVIQPLVISVIRKSAAVKRIVVSYLSMYYSIDMDW